jgi:hypothetical protein
MFCISVPPGQELDTGIPQAQLHLIDQDLEISGSLLAIARPGTDCLEICTGPDGMCYEGFVHSRYAFGAVRHE